MDRKEVKRSIRVKIAHGIKRGIRSQFSLIFPLILSFLFFSSIFAALKEDRISVIRKEIEGVIKTAGLKSGVPFMTWKAEPYLKLMSEE